MYMLIDAVFIGATLAETMVEVSKLIVAITTLVVAVTAMMISLRNGRKTDDLRIKVDGQLAKLLAVTAAAEHAKGVIEGGTVGRTVGHAEGLAQGKDEREIHDLVGGVEGKSVVVKIEEIL